MSDAFIEKKITTLFHRFDVDKSGTIEETDFDHWADRLISFGKQPKRRFQKQFLSLRCFLFEQTFLNKGNINADQGAKLRANLKLVWNAYFAPADSDGDGKITCAEVIAFFKKVNDLAST